MLIVIHQGVVSSKPTGFGSIPINASFRLVRFAILLAATLLFLASRDGFCAEASVCARVKIEIAQELTFERQAIDAHMRIENNLSNIALEDVAVEVFFKDAEGNSVTAASDTGRTDALFFIRVNYMENIAAIDGSGVLGAESTADIHWLIIPSPGASNGLAGGTLFYVGATLTYIIGGQAHVTEVAPDYIFVKPMPEIRLDYFLPEDLFGDDAWTTHVEPPEPFSLGLRAVNTGLGTAREFKIESAQPEIVDNEQGLLIDFTILSSQVQDQPAANTLLVDLGEIENNACKTARWSMTTSLSGRFIDISANYSHADELGGEITSLLDEIRTHFLIREVLVDLPGRDALIDFLARDGDILRVYESNGVDTDVIDLSENVTLESAGRQGSRTCYKVRSSATAGISFISLPDPENGRQVITGAVRSDQKQIKPQNIWISKTRKPDHTWQYWLNLLDSNSPGGYTVCYDSAVAPPRTLVMYPVDPIRSAEGEAIAFTVTADDPAGGTPMLSAGPLPAGATFRDNGNGTGGFEWTPQPCQAGVYSIDFNAAIGKLKATSKVSITVFSKDDRDSDGMRDDWERSVFGSLERDGSGDFDQDGVSDLEEFLTGSDPASGGHAPTLPQISEPYDRSRIALLQPTLVVINSQDADSDPLFYDFELFDGAASIDMIAAEYSVPEGVDSTQWPIPISLTDNHGYCWRARTTDGKSYSQWVYGRFYIGTVDSSPQIPVILEPAMDAEITARSVTLKAVGTFESESVITRCYFEIDTTPDFASPEKLVSDGVLPSDDAVSWQATGLMENTLYHWRVRCSDGTSESDWAYGRFQVNPGSDAPAMPVVLNPGDGAWVGTRQPALKVASAADPENGEPTYIFKIYSHDPSESSQVQPLITAESTEPKWMVSEELQDLHAYFWQAQVVDARGVKGPFTPISSFIVNISGVNQAPEFEWKLPEQDISTSAESLMLTWNDSDPDDNAIISLYYDVDNNGFDGVLIASGISEDPDEEADQYTWDLSGLEGRYYLYAVITDSANTQSIYAPYPVTVGQVSSSDFEVAVATSQGRALGGITVFAFTAKGAYAGRKARTDETGAALFPALTPRAGGYKFLIHYLGKNYWSGVAALPGVERAEIEIPEVTVSLHLLKSGRAVSDAKVYLLNHRKVYLGLSDRADASGRVEFTVPPGDYCLWINGKGLFNWYRRISVDSEADQEIKITLNAFKAGRSK